MIKNKAISHNDEKRGCPMKRATILFTLACISAFNTIHSSTEKLDFKDKFGFLQDLQVNTLNEAVRQIKWRIRSGYLAELNYQLVAMRWVVKKLAENFGVKTTTIAIKIGTPAAKEYIKLATRYLEILVTEGENEAKKHSHLYPEFNADLHRRDRG